MKKNFLSTIAAHFFAIATANAAKILKKKKNSNRYSLDKRLNSIGLLLAAAIVAADLLKQINERVNGKTVLQILCRFNSLLFQ